MLTAVVAVLVVFSGAGPSAAADQSLSLNYTCSFPLIGNQEVPVTIDLTLPDTITAGQSTGDIPVTANVTVPANATSGLNLVGAKTVQGTATSDVTVAQGGTSTDVQPQLTIPSTPVPSSGSFPVVASGTQPGLTFASAGDGTITIGNVSTTLDPKKADGSDTSLGTFTSNCTLDSGQNNVINFTVS